MKTFLALCGVLLLAGGARGQVVEYGMKLLTTCPTSDARTYLAACTSALQASTGIAQRYGALLNKSNLCSKIGHFGTYADCAKTAWAKCLSTELMALIPTRSIVESSYQYLCDHTNDVAIRCVVEGGNVCALQAIRTYTDTSGSNDLVTKTCSLLDTMDGCYRAVGATCPGHSRDVASTYWKKSYPPACQSTDPRSATAPHVPNHFLLLGACAVLLSKMVALF